jgi:hypothetical protein
MSATPENAPVTPDPERKMTPEEIELNWYKTVYQGDNMPQLTVRAVVMGEHFRRSQDRLVVGGSDHGLHHIFHRLPCAHGRFSATVQDPDYPAGKQLHAVDRVVGRGGNRNHHGFIDFGLSNDHRTSYPLVHTITLDSVCGVAGRLYGHPHEA